VSPLGLVQSTPPQLPASPPPVELPPVPPPVLHDGQTQAPQVWGAFTVVQPAGQLKVSPGQAKPWQLPPTHCSNGLHCASLVQLPHVLPQSTSQGPGASVPICGLLPAQGVTE